MSMHSQGIILRRQAMRKNAMMAAMTGMCVPPDMNHNMAMERHITAATRITTSATQNMTIGIPAMKTAAMVDMGQGNMEVTNERGVQVMQRPMVQRTGTIGLLDPQQE